MAQIEFYLTKKIRIGPPEHLLIPHLQRPPEYSLTPHHQRLITSHFYLTPPQPLPCRSERQMCITP